MDEKLAGRIQNYCAIHQVDLIDPLGDGVHGSVFAGEHQGKLDYIAVKFFHQREAFKKELAVYRHLKNLSIQTVCGHNVPHLLAWDEKSWAIEMTIVPKPYLLDFAGAELSKPDFSEEIVQEWEEELSDLFGSNWPKVQRILAVLEGMGIFLLDINQRNIAFEDDNTGE